MPPNNENCRWWTPNDLADELGLTDRAVRYHCRRLLGQRSRYRLNQNEAERVYLFIRKFGLKSKNLSKTFPNR